ncbi:MAG TPA: hypothetical protein VFW33_23590 [Gemmataceae bacterium]|nr:hypothetical protein [Gemmataceae bacterium]
MFVVGLLALLGVATEAPAQPPGHPSQEYTNGKTVEKWTYYKEKDCYGIWWKYWDTKEKVYKKHLVYWFRSDPTHYYYYNPETEKYWGRYDSKADGYSRLPLKYRREKLSDIKPEWFPDVEEMPIMPNSSGLQMEKPPAPPK